MSQTDVGFNNFHTVNMHLTPILFFVISNICLKSWIITQHSPYLHILHQCVIISLLSSSFSSLSSHFTSTLHFSSITPAIITLSPPCFSSTTFVITSSLPCQPCPSPPFTHPWMIITSPPSLPLATFKPCFIDFNFTYFLFLSISQLFHLFHFTSPFLPLFLLIHPV